MTRDGESVLKRAMSLDEDERAEIAGALLESLEPASEQGVEEAWREEVRNRLQSLDAGDVELVPWADLRDQLLSRLNAEP